MISSSLAFNCSKYARCSAASLSILASMRSIFRSKRVMRSRMKVRRSSLSAMRRLSHARCYGSGRDCYKSATARDALRPAAAGYFEERLVALHVALAARAFLGALVGVLHSGARFLEPRLDVGAVEVVRRDRLLHEHQRRVLDHLQVALALCELD